MKARAQLLNEVAIFIRPKMFVNDEELLKDKLFPKIYSVVLRQRNKFELLKIIVLIVYLSFIDSERGGFGEIFPEGNISPNPPSRGSINDILYRKNKMFIQNYGRPSPPKIHQMQNGQAYF